LIKWAGQWRGDDGGNVLPTGIRGPNRYWLLDWELRSFPEGIGLGHRLQGHPDRATLGIEIVAAASKQYCCRQ